MFDGKLHNCMKANIFKIQNINPKITYQNQQNNSVLVDGNRCKSTSSQSLPQK